ncbi:hypothetical protein [Streptomyces sp. NPDC048462]|uniref:hypothetical protein n=1 Tax=Streptomyces sp. NPDC048462 TaxID=3365555 RepID=UPI0037201A8E
MDEQESEFMAWSAPTGVALVEVGESARILYDPLHAATPIVNDQHRKVGSYSFGGILCGIGIVLVWLLGGSMW